jgi:hypothetical protein
MDSNQYISGGIGASIIVALLVLKQVYNTINHHRIRSNCCGNKLEASVDIDETTPKDGDKSQRVIQELPTVVQSNIKGER